MVISRGGEPLYGRETNSQAKAIDRRVHPHVNSSMSFRIFDKLIFPIRNIPNFDYFLGRWDLRAGCNICVLRETFRSIRTTSHVDQLGDGTDPHLIACTLYIPS